ncbi:MAG: hypothetical protein ACI4TG_10670 [Ruminococcus sp.]
MNRLTRVIDLHNALPLATAGIEIEEPELYAYGYAVDILSAYEDTGLTPNQVEQMKQENAELKRLLKLAVEDMKCNQSVCNLCKHSRSACPKYKKNFECFEWRYADKVKGMISDE